MRSPYIVVAGLAIGLLAACNEPEPDLVEERRPALDTSFEEKRAALETEVEAGLAGFERQIGDLREHADQADSDLTAEFVQLDEEMNRLRALLDRVRITDAAEWEALETTVRLQLAKIEDGYEDIRREMVEPGQ